MDDGQGRFVQYDTVEDLITDNPNVEFKHVFNVGEVVQVKGSLFTVSKIINNGLKLKLLPRQDILYDEAVDGVVIPAGRHSGKTELADLRKDLNAVTKRLIDDRKALIDRYIIPEVDAE